MSNQLPDLTLMQYQLYLIGMVVARVRMNNLTTEAYKQSFSAIFKTTSTRIPAFSVGGSLEGILVDWSDAQLTGLEQAVGKDVADKVVKGCQVSVTALITMCHLKVFSTRHVFCLSLQVHFQRSVKRVSEKVNRRNEAGHRVFTTIGYNIPKVDTQEEVLTLFAVLAGEEPLLTAATLLKSDEIKSYTSDHNIDDWKVLKFWKQWWTKPKHLGK